MKKNKIKGVVLAGAIGAGVAAPIIGAPIASAATLQTSITMSAAVPEIGTKINVNKGTWAGVGTISYSYRWEFQAPGSSTWTVFRSGAVVTGVIPTASQLGGYIRVAILATDANGTTTSYGPAVGPVRYPAAPAWIDGGATGANPGPTIFIGTPTSWGGYVGTTLDTWQRSTDDGATWADTNVTGGVYTPKGSDNGALFRVKSTCTNGSTVTTMYSNIIQPQDVMEMSGSLALNGKVVTSISETGSPVVQTVRYDSVVDIDLSNLQLTGITLNDTFWSWVVKRNGVEIYRSLPVCGFNIPFPGVFDTAAFTSPDLLTGDVLTAEVVSAYGPKIVSSPYIITSSPN